MPTVIYQYHYEDCYGELCESPMFANREAAHAWFDEASAEKCTHNCGCFDGRCNSLADQGKDHLYPSELKILTTWPDELSVNLQGFTPPNPYKSVEGPSKLDDAAEVHWEKFQGGRNE